MTLSGKAQEIINAAVNSNDIVMYLRSMGGTTIQVGANSTLYGELRQIKEIESAMDELVSQGHLIDRARKGQIFVPTPKAYGITEIDNETMTLAKEIIGKAVGEQDFISFDMFQGVGIRVGVGNSTWGRESPQDAIQTEVACLWLTQNGYIEQKGDRTFEPTHLAFTTFNNQSTQSE